MHITIKYQDMMNNSLKVIALREMRILKTLTPAQLETLAAEAIFGKVAKNAVIYNIGSPMDYVYLVEKGSVKLGMVASCGKTLTKELVYDNEVFGENNRTGIITVVHKPEGRQFSKSINPTNEYYLYYLKYGLPRIYVRVNRSNGFVTRIF